MGYGMKYTQGGFPFKEIETGTDRVSPVSPSPNLLKTGDLLPLDKDGNEKKMPHVSNQIDDDAYEQAINSYDTNKPTQNQIAIQRANIDDENKHPSNKIQSE